MYKIYQSQSIQIDWSVQIKSYQIITVEKITFIIRNSIY